MAAADFYDRVARISDFGALAGNGAYVPVPHDWVLGLADIENSTAAGTSQPLPATQSVDEMRTRSGRVSGHTSRTEATILNGKRARFSALPPYESSRWFESGDRNV